MKPIDSFLVEKTKWYANSRAENRLLVAMDLLAIGLSAAITAALFGTGLTAGSMPAVPLDGARLLPLAVLAALACATIVAFWAKGHYSSRRPYANEMREVLGICLSLAAANAVIFFLLRCEFSRGALVLGWVVAPCFVMAARTVLKVTLIRLGGWARPMVIVGWGHNALETALAFESEKLMGYSLVAFLVPQGQNRDMVQFKDRSGRAIPCVSLGARPEVTLANLGNPHVVLALEQGGIDRYQDIIQELGRRSLNMQVVPSLRGLPLCGMKVDHFFAHEVLLLTVRNNLARRFPRLLKRAFDIVVAGTALVLFSPLFAWVSLRIMRSGGPVFYGHERRGQHNRAFACYKFRTMAPDSDQLLKELLMRDPEARAEWERDFKLKNDPRITPIGHFLRRTSLDELPQLWNVLKGEMSLVGPRPVVEAELERYGSQVDYYFEAKPGITGLWQISGRNDITYDTRVYLDAWYVKNWSLFTDIMILLRTVGVILRRDGAY